VVKDAAQKAAEEAVEEKVEKVRAVEKVVDVDVVNC
jgi:hypothetical protein